MLQTQASDIETAIKEEFEKLHLFLWEEEKHRLKVLRQEEDIKNQVMCEKLRGITDHIETLSSTISDIEMVLKAKDLLFLQVLLPNIRNIQYNNTQQYKYLHVCVFITMSLLELTAP